MPADTIEAFRLAKSSCCPKYFHTSLSTLLNMAFSRNTRHALHCQRSPPTLLPASQENSRLTEQCSSRSIWELHSKMWTINKLLDCVYNTSIPATIRRLLHNYMKNKRTKVHFRLHEYRSTKVKTGVVQGGVLLPALINYYLTDFPTQPPNIKLTKNADDITIYASGLVVADLVNGLNIYLSQMLNYINNKILTVSTAKSTVTHFIPDTHEHHLHPQVKLDDQVLPLEKKLKVLGATFDTKLTSTQHCNNIAVKVHQHNSALKALAGSTWSCDKETLLMTYQAIGRSILSYCCPVWTPSRKDTNWSLLQLAQSPALRIATDCL